MPKIHTHLALAMKLSQQININNLNAFLLGNAYPDIWDENIDEAIYEFEKFASRTNGNDIGIFDYNKLFPEAKEIYNILLSIRNDKKTS